MPSFNSRTPGGVRLLRCVKVATMPMFQFTHPGRGATRSPSVGSCRLDVSIHAPREGCDLFIAERFVRWVVSIHAPREGCDATSELQELLNGVSIHAPREGCDVLVNPFRLLAYQFQFTHPGRGATSANAEALKRMRVSIHAPREGCDRLGYQ